VVDPRSGRPAHGVLSVTVVGPDIVEADVHATAALARGRPGLELIEHLRGYEGYAIFADLRASWTSGFDALCDPLSAPAWRSTFLRAAGRPFHC
jgi:FAD:protein FMN transferase